MNKIRPLQKQFASINEAMAHLALELALDGQSVQVINSEGKEVETIEFLDYNVIFAPKYNNIITLPTRKFPIKGAYAEFLWYMTGNAQVEPITKYLKNWARFANEDGTVNSNYGVYWVRMIPKLIDMLIEDKYSRRAVLNIYNDRQIALFGKDTPCTLSIQFIIRNDQLNMIVQMRSNDVWYGLGLDQFSNSLLHQLVYNELLYTYPKLQMGWYSHHSASMHAYVSTASRETLVQLYKDYAEDPDNSIGQRFELPEYITINNFWEVANSYDDVFVPEMFDHFHKFSEVKYQYGKHTEFSQ